MNNNYEKKYLKYKHKYFNLKNQLGGHDSLTDQIVEIREEIKNGMPRDIILNLVDDLLSDTYNEFQKSSDLDSKLENDNEKYIIASQLPKAELDKISDTDSQTVHFSTINVLNNDGSNEEIPLDNPFLRQYNLN